MKQHLIILILFCNTLLLFGQNDRKIIRKGIREYQDGNYSEAEIKFRMAEDINENSFEAKFNTGASLYGQEKYEETLEQYKNVINETKNPASLSKVWHNIGNSLLESQQFAQSIDAYKNSLRLNPEDMDTKYNLAYAQKKLQEQQQQQQQNQDNEDKEKNQDNQNQDQQQQQDKEQQQNEEEQKQQQEQEKEQQQSQDQQEQPRVDQELSKEDAERMLEAIMQEEKDVKEKVDRKKAAAAKVKTEKDW